MNIKNLSIKWKIMAIAILGPVVITMILAYQRIEDIQKGSENTVLAKSRAIVYMAESARIEMGKRLEMGIMKPIETIDKSVRLDAVPVIAAIQMARKNADANGYKFRVPKFSPRNPENEPTPIEAQIINEIKASNLNEKILYEADQIRYFKPIRLTQDCLYCHGDVKGEKDPMGGIKEGWKVGEIHGVFEIISSMAESNQIVAQAKRNILMWAIFILSIIFVLTFILLKTNLLTPLKASTDLIAKIVEGDMTHSIQINREDEFGNMITNLNGMGKKLREIIIAIRSSASDLNNASTELSDISGIMRTSVDDVTNRANTVAAAMEEMSTNAQVVASGAEQMTLTINEISQNTENARSITENAVNQAQSTSIRVDELGKAAIEIDKVTETITKISEQTNLLALNATIEAARAGSAGKGFAVVANEIKELAKQTTFSTGEIREKIEGIQFSIEATVKEISEITKVINGINEIVTVIATAVEEQSITTKEIANNVSETSQVSKEVAKDVTDVLISSQEMAENSMKVSEKSEEQSKLADKLDQMMSNFIV